MAAWPQPPSLAEQGSRPVPLGEVLRMTKQELVDIDPSEASMYQPGGVILADNFELPDLNEGFVDLDEALIETFVVGEDGRCVPTGSDHRVAEALGEAAARLADLSRSELDRMGQSFRRPAYVTASITPLELVSNHPHFDDEQFDPVDGVGVVITVADGAGTRLAISSLGLQPPRRGVPWSVDPTALVDFDADGRELQEVGANQVMAMARFGQLHAGPVTTATPGSDRTGSHLPDSDGQAGHDGVRVLLVFRADTIPQPGRAA